METEVLTHNPWLLKESRVFFTSSVTKKKAEVRANHNSITSFEMRSQVSPCLFFGSKVRN